ncbi:MAG: class I SAM-dependent methyltransferase [Anaerolineales bacterium]|nr:class I SAM-dependent methyltransferase [Anaerolineales bacterium]
MSTEMKFFDFAAAVGLTKHIGGMDATRQLIELCQIEAGKYVLDVGCGVGVTAVYLAKQVGARVVGVDIRPEMIKRAIERAIQEGVDEPTDFRVADAQELRFEDNTFDAVITESVTAFLPDKRRDLAEYVRVTKPGGYVGINESAWLKTPVPAEVVDWFQRDVGNEAEIPAYAEWLELMEGAGLVDVNGSVDQVDVKDEFRGIMQRYGFWEMLKIYGRMFKLYRRSPEYRQFIKEAKETGAMPPGATDYFGYGICVGRKPVDG